MIARRTLLAASAAPLLGQTSSGLWIGVMDGVVRQASRPEAVRAARGFGAAALQVTLGRTDGGKILLSDAGLQQRLRAESEAHKVPIASTYIDLLHVHCLKNDPQARSDILEGIHITRNLKARVLMTVFFGKCAIANRQERDYVADVFRELAPEAARSGVILGFENLLTAEDQAQVMDRVASDAFRIYYDVGNATNMVGVDAPNEIRRLGRDRICEFHFKDKSYLGEGKVNFPEVLRAVNEIGFQGYAMLETSSPSGDFAADLNRNMDYLKGLMA